jgi:membrane protein involved in colicin uptake
MPVWVNWTVQDHSGTATIDLSSGNTLLQPKSSSLSMCMLAEAVVNGHIDQGTVNQLTTFSLHNIEAEKQVTKTAEQNRLTAEQQRMAAEEMTKQKEMESDAAIKSEEQATKTAEQNRLAAEAAIKTAEQHRLTAEQQRMAAVETTKQRKLELAIQRLQQRSDATDTDPPRATKRPRRSPRAESAPR